MATGNAGDIVVSTEAGSHDAFDLTTPRVRRIVLDQEGLQPFRDKGPEIEELLHRLLDGGEASHEELERAQQYFRDLAEYLGSKGL